MKIALATMTYGPVDPVCAASVVKAVMHASNHGHQFVTYLSPDRMPYRAARAAIQRAIVEWPDGPQDAAYPDGVLWVDSDMVIPAEGFTRLLSHGLEFVSGLYYHRVEPHHPVCGELSPVSGKVQWCMALDERLVKQGKLYKMSASGFGIMYTSTRVINAVSKTVFFDETVGEDVAFCKEVKAKGIAELHVDSGVVAGHMGEPEIIGPEHFDLDKAGKMLYTQKNDQENFYGSDLP